MLRVRHVMLRVRHVMLRVRHVMLRVAKHLRIYTLLNLVLHSIPQLHVRGTPDGQTRSSQTMPAAPAVSIAPATTYASSGRAAVR